MALDVLYKSKFYLLTSMHYLLIHLELSAKNSYWQRLAMNI